MKLTDAVLRELADALESIDHPWAMQYVEAIRSLRDAAKALCDSHWDFEWGNGRSISMSVDYDQYQALREMLPEKH